MQRTGSARICHEEHAASGARRLLCRALGTCGKTMPDGAAATGPACARNTHSGGDDGGRTNGTSSKTVPADAVLGATSSGGACVNHVVLHITPPNLPFGGVGEAGIGRYHGQSGFDTFSNLKSVMRKPTKPDPSILYPPYTGLKEKLIRKFL